MTQPPAEIGAVPVTINGEVRTLPRLMTVAELLTYLEIRPGQAAVEMNREIVPRSRHAEVRVEAGAVIEIVRAVGGG